MKKILALILAVVMAVSFSVVGMAEDSGIVPYGGGGGEGDSATMLNGKAPYYTVYIEMPVEDPKGTGVLVTLDILEIFEDKDNWRAIPSNSTNHVFYFSKATRVSKNGWAHYQCRIKPLGSTKVEVGDVLEDTLSISLLDGDRSFQETFTINMTIVEGAVTTPDKPTPGTPRPPVVDSGNNSHDNSEPSPTENAANNDKTLDKLAAGESAEAKLTSGSAALSTDTMDTLGSHSGKLTVTVDKMTVAIPGGFGKVNEPGRIYYPMDFSDNLANAGDLAAAVKGDKAKTEVVKAGGDMVMPTTVTVTLKTKLTGTVNVYYYNPETRRYTLLASPVAKEGKVTFATKQMGHLVLTTGTI